jgi:hypothetical protein
MVVVGDVRNRQFDGLSVARKCICPGAGRGEYRDKIEYVPESRSKGLGIHEDRSLDEGFNRPQSVNVHVRTGRQEV